MPSSSPPASQPDASSPGSSSDNFDFDQVGVRPATKSPRFKDDPRQPGVKCDFFDCKRRQNLWPYEFDTKTLWLCWPHYRRYKDRTPPYRGRMKHHDFAIQHLERPDYPRDERVKHADFAKRVNRGELSRTRPPGV